MKPLNEIELDHLIEELKKLEGAKLQNSCLSEGVLVLNFWKEGAFYLAVNVLKGVPFSFLIEDRAIWPKSWFKKSTEKPLTLFLKSRFFGETVKKVCKSLSSGRVFSLEFEHGGVFEVRVFPGGANAGALINGKSVYLKKPLPLNQKDSTFKPESVRSPEVIRIQALELFVKKGGDAKEAKENKSDVAKRKIEEALLFLKTDPHLRFSEALKEKRNLPEDLKEFYNKKLSDIENMEWGYAQHKKKGLKVMRLESRLKDLSEYTKAKSKESATPSTRAPQNTYTLQVSDKLVGWCGKNAKDNAKLLRSSKAWSLWMHLKDFPSGHLIINKPKKYALTEKELKKFALFLFSKGAPKKLFAVDQIKFEVIFTECRHVRPIKGGKPGLVQASQTNSRLYTWDEKSFYAD